ncbi:MAG: chemotaxis protein CheA, partial [Lachnospiraceae bacterium]|nr:chemotaxis protein CheA [Lachnospiraceae bacterium]
DETNEHLQALSDNIMILEKEPENADTVNEIFRAAHSLKGMAGTMGFKRMQHLTHDMENLFQEVRNDTIKVNSELIDIMFQCLDAIEGYLDTVKETSNEGTEDNEVLIKKINTFLESGGASSEGGAAPEAAAGGEASDAAAEDPNAPEQFKHLTLDEEERAKIVEASDSGLNLFGFTVHIQEDCLLKAARAFLAFKAMEDFGEILVYNPNSQDIEDEKFEFTFNTIISSNNDDLGPIKEAVLAVSEIASVEADKVTPDMYPEPKEEESAAEPPAEAAPAAPAEPPKEEKPAPAPEKKPAKTGGKGAKKSQKTANKPVTSRTVRVDIEKLDALMNQVSELIIAKNSLVALSSGENGTGNSDADTSQFFHEQIEYLERVATSLHESVMQVRMVPIETTVNKFPRMIRDLSRKLNKPMELVMTGEETELDRTVVDQIGDPLQHLLRNSADHGIESVEERRKNGKPETGNIFLNAFQEGNNVIIQVGDDGGGINTDAVLNKAIERGIVSEDEAENLSQKEIIDFLFMPSFSMAKQITDISGRGVGLDVVKSNIEALGGDVEVKSVMGQGSTFTVRLPLTLAIIQALMVEVRTEKYAIALASIMTIETIPVDEVKYVEASEVIHLRGMVIPMIRLDEVLDSEPKEEEERDLTVVVVKKGDNAAALVVDNLLGQQEIVIKSIGKVIENNKIISGATILGDGEVALILDVNALF